MPKIEWEELSIIRHDLSNVYSKICHLENTIRSWHVSHNTFSTVDLSIKEVEKIKEKIWLVIDDIDDLTIKHETEEK